jgi:hypothetical protein
VNASKFCTGFSSSRQDDQNFKVVVLESAVDTQSLELLRSAKTRNMAKRQALSQGTDTQGSELASQQARKTAARIKLTALENDETRVHPAFEIYDLPL